MFFEFSHYWWLIFLFFPLILGAKQYTTWQKKRHHSSLFFQNQTHTVHPYFWEIKMGMIFLGLFFIMLSVWRPQWGENVQYTAKKGLDIVFAVDVSKSMKALDFSQGRQLISRLDATKFLVEQFINQRKSDRIGLIEFAGESFVASPLTLDHMVFLNFLKNISSDDLGKQGTNLAEAIDISLGRLEVQSEEERGKAIILFSDGDETISSDAKQMAKLAKSKGIKIFTVGIGSEKGMPIPEGQDAFGQIFYKQWKGETVLTALNPDPLQKIASITGGEYFHAEDIGDLKHLQKTLAKLPQRILEEESISPTSEQYFLFSFIGLLLFLGGFIMPKNIFTKN